MQPIQNTTPIIPQLFMSSTDAVTTKTVGGPISLADLLHCLSGGNSAVKSKVEALRTLVKLEADKEQILRVKKSLPAIYPHILFKKKGSLKAGNSDFDLTGLVHVDIDGKSSSDAVWIKNKLMGMSPTPLLAFLSPSGTGVKCIFATDLAKIHDGSSEAIGGSAETKKHNFKRGWSFLKDKVNATLETRFTVDTAPSSTNSTFFCSYDPNFYLNLDALNTPIELDSTPDIKFRKTKSPSNSSMTEPTLTTSTNSSANSASTPKLKKMGLAHMCTDAPKVLQTIDKIIGATLPSSNRKKAESAVKSYLETPIGMGKRHSAFFTASVHLTHCGLSKSMLADVLDVLDYDQSRDPDDVMDQLEKYGLLNKKVQALAPIDAIKSHLSDLMTVDKTLLVDQWLSDAKDEILDVLHSHKITMLDGSTGIGKTRFCMETLPGLWGGRIFFACPTTVLRDQIAYNAASPDIQFLEAEHELSPTAKVVVTTYEKLVYTTKHWSPCDLVIIDEVHLMELGFRHFASKILMQEAVESPPKFLIMSATGQGLGCTLKRFVGDQVCVLKVRKKQVKDLSIDIKICKSPIDRAIDATKAELVRDPNAKVLVYRNSLDDLDEIAKIIGPDALVVSSETKSTDPRVEGMFKGVEPKERVICCSSLVEIGVNLPSLTKILVSSGSGPQIQVSNIIQISDRARRPVPVEWFVSKSHDSIQRLGHYSESFLKKYKEIVDAWVRVESTRLPLAVGTKKAKNFQEVLAYIKSSDDSVSAHTATNTEFPVVSCLYAKNDGQLSWGVQGVLEHVADMEKLAESSLSYKIAKLETVFGAKITVSTCADKANPKAQEDSVWQQLAAMSFDFASDDINQQLSQGVVSLNLRKKREKDLEHNLFKRIFTLHQAGLDLESYIFLAEGDWESLQHMLSIKANPHLHPLERAWADEIVSLGKLELFADDVKSALSACKLAPQEIHLREKMLELPPQVLSRVVSTFFKVDHGKKINPTTKMQGRYLKLLDVRPMWDNLVPRKPKPIPPPPPVWGPNFPF
jgi:hypothetical protein